MENARPDYRLQTLSSDISELTAITACGIDESASRLYEDPRHRKQDSSLQFDPRDASKLRSVQLKINPINYPFY